MRNTAPAALIALGLLMAAPAYTAPTPGKTTVRAWLGYSTFALGDINSQIEAQRNAFGSDTLVDESRWDPFGGAPNLGGELDVQITPTVSAGLGVDVHRSSVRHQMSRVFSLDPDSGEPAEFENLDEQTKISAWDVVANVSMWVPSAPGLYFGAQVGLVRGTYTNESVHHIDTFTTPSDLLLTQGTFQGTGAVLGAFTGYEQSINPQLSITTRMGYRYRQIARPIGTTNITEWGDQGNAREWESGPLLDANGHTMSLDLGGFYFQIGLSVALGGN
jgi:hypothetical protein